MYVRYQQCAKCGQKFLMPRVLWNHELFCQPKPPGA